MGPPPAGASAGIGNPFDPFAAPAASPSASAPASAASPYQQQPPQPQYGGLPQTPQSQAHSQQPQAYQQYPGQMYGAPAQAPPVPPVSPTGAYQHQQMPQMQHQQQPTQQMVLASQQSNPYAAMVSPQWGATAPANAPATAVAGNPFDPFAPAPPAPAPAPVPQMEPAYQAALAPQAYPQDPFGGGPVALAVAPPSQQPLQEFGSYAPAAPEPPVPSAVTYQEPDYSSAAHQMVAAHPPRQQEYSNYAMEAPSSPYTSGMGGAGGPPAYDPDSNGPDGDYDGNADNRQIVPAPSSSVVVHSPDQVRNQYSQAIAQYVQSESPGASPLPKAELVRKKGYVLSRISFRTIVMKKWKQSFWVQYGSHTMLWFRNEQDFDDWLNNPYHDQTQRNFLIKLAVNFVHDLYKPNVRGYQVTQCRTKPYGSKVVRQFKLERWMDYGPTIAAAFGSYDPKEVDACREAIVECMKNTPLDNGIRATGAIKEHHDRQQQLQQNQLQLENGENQHHDQHGRQQQNGGYDNGGGNGKREPGRVCGISLVGSFEFCPNTPLPLLTSLPSLQTLGSPRLSRWTDTGTDRLHLTKPSHPRSPWHRRMICWEITRRLTTRRLCLQPPRPRWTCWGISMPWSPPPIQMQAIRGRRLHLRTINSQRRHSTELLPHQNKCRPTCKPSN